MRALAAEPLAGKRVIDFGCGTGEYGIWMAGEGAEVYLVDRDRGAVDRALERARNEGLERRVRGILAAGDRLDMFADRGFDLVLVQTWPVRTILAELARAMKPGARLVGTVEEQIAEQDCGGWFEAVRAVGDRADGWLARLSPRGKRRGGTVITARRRGTAG